MKASSILLLSCCILACACNNSSHPAPEQPGTEVVNSAVPKPPPDQYNFSVLQEGDIILKMGNGKISDLIAKSLKEEVPLSHCAVICKKGESFEVIHSVAREVSGSDGLQTMSLKDFLKDTKKGSAIILRHRANSTERLAIVNAARQYLDARVPFDHHYNHDDDSEIYCSELIYLVLKDVFGKNYFHTKKLKENEVFLFNSLLNAPDFEKIPFIIDKDGSIPASPSKLK